MNGGGRDVLDGKKSTDKSPKTEGTWRLKGKLSRTEWLQAREAQAERCTGGGSKLPGRGGPGYPGSQ